MRRSCSTVIDKAVASKFFDPEQDLLCIANAENYFEFLSPAWEKLLGYSIEEMSSKTFYDFIHPEDHPSTQEVVDLTIQGKRILDYINRFIAKDGSIRWLSWSGEYQDHKFYGVARDITPLKSAEEIHSQLGRKLERIARNVPGMIYQFRIHRNQPEFTYVSDRIYEIYGITAEEALKDVNLLFQVVHPEDHPRLMHNIELSAKALKTFEWEGRITSRDGSMRWVRAKSEPEAAEDGSIIWDGILVDVSKEKEQESLIREQQIRLIAANKFSALGELSADISHEINNPLMVIQAYADELRTMRGESPQLLEKINAIGVKLCKVCDRINQTLAGLKRLAFHSPLEQFSLVTLDEVLHDVLDISRTRFARKGISLHVSSQPDPISLHCRPFQISQVLMNLILNAHDALASVEDPRIHIRAEADDREVRIIVEDNGHGISTNDASRVMDRFFTTKKPGQGLGLGLSISRSIIEEHRGELKLDSLHQPTRFVIHLPKNRVSL